MRPNWQGLALGFLLPSLVLYAGSSAAAPSSSEPLKRELDITARLSEPVALPFALLPRDGDEHAHANHHAAPLIELNETEVTMYHAPTPPSYWTIDAAERDPNEARYPGLMAVHVLMMSAAFFGALPAGIALRSVNHPWHGFSTILFWTFIVLGCGASGLYRKLTPDMYEGQKHSSQSYFVIFLAFIITAVDLVSGIGRLVSYVKSIREGAKFSISTFWHTVILGQEERPVGLTGEYVNLVAEPEELEMDLKPHASHDTHHDLDDAEDGETAQWANHVRRHSDYTDRMAFSPESPRGSQHSDDTLHESTLKRHNAPTRSLLHKIGGIAFSTLERLLIFAAYGQFLFGVVVYTGGCRENYINGCLAHLIKGGIFWCYGLVTFGRFLGSFAEYGWAWNRTPVGEYISAEMVESFVIFLYGVTNTWMERFGAHPGDPYTTKQVQHISIAVMFWFAGLVGMGLESRRFRRWLAGASTAAINAGSKVASEAVAEPPSYTASFNPFPALVIGVTGVAMSAHFQEYLFQVQIHALWGYLLAGFAVLRCLTYFFLWLGPPRSILPSRPPTEALGSFFLACGGLVFIFSDEEITIAAMRQGHDDVMMFANVAVAITCFAFCWALCVVGFKGWLKSRTHSAVSFHSSA